MKKILGEVKKGEMVSGHRRMHAAILLGMDRIPAIIREMSDDEAIVKMVDANIQREELLPSESSVRILARPGGLRKALIWGKRC